MKKNRTITLRLNPFDLSMRSFTFSVVAAALLAVLSVNADLIAWSGNTCDGDQGNNVPCDGSCHQFGGRHSFEVSLKLQTSLKF